MSVCISAAKLDWFGAILLEGGFTLSKELFRKIIDILFGCAILAFFGSFSYFSTILDPGDTESSSPFVCFLFEPVSLFFYEIEDSDPDF
jgi:hypothetical protein